MKQLKQLEHNFMRAVQILLATNTGTSCSSTDNNDKREIIA
jgi:hypothetical protein